MSKSTLSEFSLIARLRERAALRADVVLGIGDDAALLKVPENKLLAVTTDTLSIGTHFPDDTDPYDIGWKSLAVNLSDLTAMGAQPAWISLALRLPQADADWLMRFADGFFALADLHQVALIGGDTTRGTLSITITAHGLVDPDSALRRSGARSGDAVWITGTLGDAAGALSQWKSGMAIDHALALRLNRPTPRVAAGIALQGLASAAIDISDGLDADLGHLLQASGQLGAQVALDALPVSEALQKNFIDAAMRWALQVSGGDDYELCFTTPKIFSAQIEQRFAQIDLPVHCIGEIIDSPGIHYLQNDGKAWRPSQSGFDHFKGNS